jgi:hypothetical protein
MLLQGVLKGRLSICQKLALGDPFFSQAGDRYHNRIARKPVDFLLCEPSTMSPKLGIELDDDSHERKDRREWDPLWMRYLRRRNSP